MDVRDSLLQDLWLGPKVGLHKIGLAVLLGRLPVALTTP